MRRLAAARLLPLLFGLFLLAVTSSAGLPAQDSSASPASQSKTPATTNKANAQSASPEACKACHQAEYTSWEKSPHWKTTLDKKADSLHQGCQGCHGSAAAHLADPTDTSKLFKLETASPKDVIDRCLGCHSGDMEQAHALNSVHAKNGVACIACHSPHHATQPEFLLVKAQPELCYTCHLAKEAEFAMPFHHRVNEHLIQCTDCHNPHGAAEPTQVRTAATQDMVCFKCHIDKQGPFVYEHVPVKTDGCESCHMVHGSPNAHMLKVSNVNLLCLQCHTTSSFSGAPGAPSFHNQASFFQACTLCHVAIHGSNFSSTFFK